MSVSPILSVDEIDNKFVKNWIKYCGKRESPFIFNLWSGLAAVSACMGRRNMLHVGAQEFSANMYVVLVGPTAVRKSTAGKLASKLIRKHTEIKFGPTDTAGKKQGLIGSFFRQYKSEEEELIEEKTEKVNDVQSSIFDKSKTGASIASEKPSPFAAAFAKRAAKQKTTVGYSPDEPRELFVFADELTTFIGLNQIEMVDCISELYYPQPFYEYTLAKTSSYVPNPILTILGCTTPTRLSSHLPPSSIGAGFTSRAIFVYCGHPEDKVYPVPSPSEKLGDEIAEVFSTLSQWSENFTLASPEVEEFIGNIYRQYKPSINDHRFDSYESRRLEHMQKLAMVLAGAELRTVVTNVDILNAHRILEFTEIEMSSAMGEVGMDKLSIAKQHMKEIIENSHPHGVQIATLRGMMARDLGQRDFDATLEDFKRRKLCMEDKQKVEIRGKMVEIPILIPAMPVKKTNTKPKTSIQILKELDLA